MVKAEFKRDKKKETIDIGITDADGMVNKNLDPGKYKFMATHENYKSGDEEKEVKAGSPYVLTIKVNRR